MQGRPSVKRTPQDKKSLSYAKDRRNAFGENDKASRKAVPARKAAENRKSRRKAAHALTIIERIGEVAAEVSESSLSHDIERVGGWRKAPDTALREVVDGTRETRAWREGRKNRVRDEAERQRSAPDFAGGIHISSSIHDRDRR